MKKGSIVSFIFSCILFVFGVGFIIASFRQAMAPVSIQHFAEGFTMRLSINNLNMAISSISLMLLILGSTFFISSFILLLLSCYLNISSKNIINNKDEIIETNIQEKNELNKSEESDNKVIEIQPKEDEKK